MPNKTLQRLDSNRQAIDNNPCGMCRTLGMLSCKGHGGDSGGGKIGGSGGGQGNDSGSGSPLSNVTPPIPSLITLEKMFNNSPFWLAVPDEDLMYEFNNPDALIGITLDLTGSIRFFSKNAVSATQLDDIGSLYQAIVEEFLAFKNDLASQGIDTSNMVLKREEGQLILKIPKPEYFDAFIQRLMDKNLLITQSPSNNLEMELPSSDDIVTLQSEDVDTLYSEFVTDKTDRLTAPTPFDMSGPKPKGFDINS